MKAVILDAASLGPDIDLSAIRDQVETLEVHEASTTEQSRQRLAGAQVAIVNKVVLDAATPHGRADQLRRSHTRARLRPGR